MGAKLLLTKFIVVKLLFHELLYSNIAYSLEIKHFDLFKFCKRFHKKL